MRAAARHITLLVVMASLAVMGQVAAASAAELLMFEKDGCPWCLRWHQEIGTGYPKSEEGRKAPLRVFRMTRPTALAEGLKSPVTHAPTFVLVDKGQEIGRIVGYPGADFFYGLLGELLQKSSRQSQDVRQPQDQRRPAT